MRELAESVHHYLRTPLTAVLGHADLLREHSDELPAHVQDSVAGILRAGLRLDEVVASICDLVDAACGYPGEVEPVDVSQLLAGEVSACREAAASEGLRIDHAATGRAMCTADPGRLRRAARALLEHVMAHALPGSEIRVTTAPTDTGARVTMRCHAPAAHADGDPATEPRELDALTDDAAVSAGIRVAIASAVARAYGGRLGLVDIPAVAVQLDLPRELSSPTECCAHRRGGRGESGE